MTSSELAGGGFLHLLPMRLPEDVTVEAVVASMLPWAAPGFTGQRGHAPDGEPVLVLAYEWPIPWVHTAEPISKRNREFLHVQRFAADFLGTGTLPFWSLAEGGTHLIG